MEKDKGKSYPERVIEDHELARQLDLAYLEDWLQRQPKDERNRKALVVGTREYSIEDMLDEIRKDAVYAEMFRSLFRKIRLARAGAIKRCP